MIAPVIRQPNIKESHPPGLYLLFFTEMWERFSFYGMRGMLILYMTRMVAEGGLQIPKADASILYGIIQGLCYATPILGGIIADKYLGQRKGIVIGGILMMLGQFFLASTKFADLGIWSFYSGLCLIIVGNGLFKPNISTIVGQLYEDGDARRDSAFTIFYMGINLGAMLAPIVCSLLAETIFLQIAPDGTKIYAYQYGFMAAGIGMLIGQVLFNSLAQKYLGNKGNFVAAQVDATGKKVPVATVKLSKQETDRIAVILVITAFTFFFWAAFEQAGTSLSLYTDKFINRNVGGFEIGTTFFQALNPLFILILGFPVGALWVSLAKKGKNPNLVIKMGLGMIILGIGFFFMVGAVMERGDAGLDANVKASIWWLVATYLFHTIGELMLSPIGLSMVTKLAPVVYASMLMGVWFLSPFLAHIAGGFVEHYVEQLGALRTFGGIGVLVIIFGFILLSFTKKLVFMMHGKG